MHAYCNLISTMHALTNICSWCNAWNSISWSYDSVCSDTVFNSSVGREVPQCELCGWCVGVVQYSSAVVGDLIHCDDTIRFWGSSPWYCELDHSWSGWQTRHWTRNCTGTHTNNAPCSVSTVSALLTTSPPPPLPLSCKPSHCCYGQQDWFQQCSGLLVCPLISTSWLWGVLPGSWWQHTQWREHQQHWAGTDWTDIRESFILCSGIWSRGRTCAAQCSQ